MTHIAKPQFRHPNAKTNSVGLTRRDYEGVISTLCAGCGHDSVTAAIVEAQKVCTAEGAAIRPTMPTAMPP